MLPPDGWRREARPYSRRPTKPGAAQDRVNCPQDVDRSWITAHPEVGGLQDSSLVRRSVHPSPRRSTFRNAGFTAPIALAVQSGQYWQALGEQAGATTGQLPSGLGPVGIVNTELNENMELARPSPISLSGAQRPTRGRRQHVGRLQIASHTPVGEPRPPAPTRRSASLGKAAQTDVYRPSFLDLAMRSLERLAIFPDHRQAGNRHCLGIVRASGCSGPGKFVAETWATGSSQRRPGTDSQNVPRESDLGRSSHPR